MWLARLGRLMSEYFTIPYLPFVLCFWGFFFIVDCMVGNPRKHPPKYLFLGIIASVMWWVVNMTLLASGG